MNMPDLAELFAAMDATWPAAEQASLGPWLLRKGLGAGNRVSSATALGPVTEADIDAAVAQQRAWGQVPLFMIRAGDEDLDAKLAARGFRKVDEVALRIAPVSQFEPPEVMRSFAHWPPLALGRDIWAEYGIGAARQDVMERVAGAKTAILARAKAGADRAAGISFVAQSGRVAMVHAVVVIPELRRQGSAHNMMRAAAAWARDNGAEWLALLVTTANQEASELYTSLKMPVVGSYHYRSA